MKSRIVYYGVLGLFVVLLLTSYVYAQSTCVGVVGNRGEHSFDILGTVASVTTVGSNTWLVIDTNTGPGADLYNVKCGNGIFNGFVTFVNVSGPIVLQSCSSGLSHSVIFRGENIFY